MSEASTQVQATEPAKAEERAAQPARQRRVRLAMKDVMAVINDGDHQDLPDVVEELNRALYRFGAQDPSYELPRSWQRVQRRIGVDPNKLDGVATEEQVARFADKAGLTISK